MNGASPWPLTAFRRQFFASGKFTTLRLHLQRFPRKWLSCEAVERVLRVGRDLRSVLQGAHCRALADCVGSPG